MLERVRDWSRYLSPAGVYVTVVTERYTGTGRQLGNGAQVGRLGRPPLWQENHWRRRAADLVFAWKRIRCNVPGNYPDDLIEVREARVGGLPCERYG